MPVEKGSRTIHLSPGERITIIGAPRLPSRSLLTSEQIAAQNARNLALGHARDAARQLALPLRQLQGGDPDLMSIFTTDSKGRLIKLAKELQRTGITRDNLLGDITKVYRSSQHPPTDEEAFDLARSFVDSLPGFAGEEED